ncbi:hypothetical protein AVEN_159397-1 [Araneus ventricosus]|uniref:Uncharacterized protein n=1 Tax=Araneus ventricosus TaxID=182803 RepID=A0A4Y2A137_ARAVE|nr:hypothetical protein AVEN_159397-1 [Araneus ventricosus]
MHDRHARQKRACQSRRLKCAPYYSHFDPIELLPLLFLQLSKRDTSAAFAREPHFPSPTCQHFVLFCFCDRALLSLPKVAFQFFGPTFQMYNERRCKSKLFDPTKPNLI